MVLKHQTVTIPSVQAGVEIAGQKISPDSPSSSSPRPTVILAHGVTCTMEYGIAAYAEVHRLFQENQSVRLSTDTFL